MSKVLVTGGAGFIGSHTVDLLLERGYAVRVLDALLPPVHLDGQVPDYLPLDEIEFIRDDVRSKTAWEQALEGIEFVIHLAAYQDYLPDFSRFFHINTVGTALLYEVIVERRLSLDKVVIASSQAVYGEAKYACLNESCPQTENQGSQIRYPPLRSESQLSAGDWEVGCPDCGRAMQWQVTDEPVVNPHNQYAISKYTQEMVALNFGKRYRIPTAGMRYSIVQGSRQSFRNAYSGVLRIFSQRVLNGRPPVCYEDGNQLRDYVSVHDVSQANLLVMENAGTDYQVFNVGGDRQVSVLEYAQLVSARANVDIEPEVPGKYRFGDTRHVISDVSKLKALGWQPKIAMESIVDEYLAWAKIQPDFRDYYNEAESKMEALGTLRKVGR